MIMFIGDINNDQEPGRYREDPSVFRAQSADTQNCKRKYGTQESQMTMSITQS